jgi:hypothetical protein
MGKMFRRRAKKKEKLLAGQYDLLKTTILDFTKFL